MEPSEDIKEAKDILQTLIKAKKTLRMYPPNNPEIFQAVFINPENHTISWPIGIDLCPDTLYAEITGIDILPKVIYA